MCALKNDVWLNGLNIFLRQISVRQVSAPVRAEGEQPRLAGAPQLQRQLLLLQGILRHEEAGGEVREDDQDLGDGG